MDPRRARYKSQYQPLMNRCKDLALVSVNALLAELFENARKALNSFAQKAETNELQTRIFDAIVIIKDKQEFVESEFRKSLTKSFDLFWEAKNTLHPVIDDDSELSLVDHDTMNENTVLENIITRTSNDYRAQLFALGQRLSVVKGGEQMTFQQIPAGPNSLSHGFNEALNSLGLQSNIKIIILTLFNKYVLKQLGTLYKDYNNTLIEAGVLPHMRPSVTRSSSEPTSRDDGRSSEASKNEQNNPKQVQPSSSELGDELFESIVGLMANRQHLHASQVGAVKNAAQNPPPPPGGAVPQQPGNNLGGSPAFNLPAGLSDSSINVLSALNQIQPSKRSSYIPDASANVAVLPNIEIDQTFLNRVKQTLAEERNKLYDQMDGRRLDAADEDTIDLVGMLFEYMLNDPVLPAIAKALISHLHTPYLKIAIIDRRVLSDSNHDARQLLDDLVEAGSRWIDERNLKRGVYPEIQNVVDRVLKEFSNDLQLFTELKDQFKQCMAEFKRKSDQFEQRSMDSIKGREKLGMARQRAAQEMKARTFSENFPKGARDFLEQTWVDRLIFILLRHPDGDRSAEWKESLRIADEITWIFEPKHSAAELDEVQKNLAALKNSIEKGLESLGGFHQEESAKLFELFNKSREHHPAPAKPKSPAAVKATLEKHEEEEEKIPVEVLSMMGNLRKVEYGTWFEIPNLIGPHETLRVKFSWLSPLTQSCMFVDRAGVQVAIKPLHELAQEILNSQSKIIEDSNVPFVERTFRAIKRMLQHPTDASDENNARPSFEDQS